MTLPTGVSKGIPWEAFNDLEDQIYQLKKRIEELEGKPPARPSRYTFKPEPKVKPKHGGLVWELNKMTGFMEERTVWYPGNERPKEKSSTERLNEAIKSPLYGEKEKCLIKQTMDSIKEKEEEKENKFNWISFEYCLDRCQEGSYFWFYDKSNRWVWGCDISTHKDVEEKIKNGNYKKSEYKFVIPWSKQNKAKNMKDYFSKTNPKQMIIKNLDGTKYDVYYK